MTFSVMRIEKRKYLFFIGCIRRYIKIYSLIFELYKEIYKDIFTHL